MSDSKSSSSGGVGAVSLPTIVFIVLKLTGYIAWSWWWVLSPLWIAPLSVIAIGFLGLAVWLIYQAVTS